MQEFFRWCDERERSAARERGGDEFGVDYRVSDKFVYPVPEIMRQVVVDHVKDMP